MNQYFILAAILVFALGIVHSVAGELLLIRRLDAERLPFLTGSREFTRGTLKACWHAATVLGWGFGAILVRLAQPGSIETLPEFSARVMAVSFLASGLLVLACTRARHPGWIVLLAAAVLTWLGAPVPR